MGGIEYSENNAIRGNFYLSGGIKKGGLNLVLARPPSLSIIRSSARKFFDILFSYSPSIMPPAVISIRSDFRVRLTRTICRGEPGIVSILSTFYALKTPSNGSYDEFDRGKVKKKKTTVYDRTTVVKKIFVFFYGTFSIQ